MAQTRNLIQNGQPIVDKSFTEQGRMIDHHQVLEQILSLARQGQPLNRIALQAVAATLMAQTGGLIYSLLSSLNTVRETYALTRPWSEGGKSWRLTNYPQLLMRCSRASTPASIRCTHLSAGL
ncbi:hypothetical protein [Spirosoma endophyticum]|uniref:hypothetical protein n=1 Tax=Spirosoma endophyticum TaxID=662367 RepID=UPI0015A72E73|nr:hypothetical protein [Spirosoma endophyticum]